MAYGWQFQFISAGRGRPALSAKPACRLELAERSRARWASWGLEPPGSALGTSSWGLAPPGDGRAASGAAARTAADMGCSAERTAAVGAAAAAACTSGAAGLGAAAATSAASTAVGGPAGCRRAALESATAAVHIPSTVRRAATAMGAAATPSAELGWATGRSFRGSRHRDARRTEGGVL
jgi:hypothetical protein